MRSGASRPQPHARSYLSAPYHVSKTASFVRTFDKPYCRNLTMPGS